MVIYYERNKNMPKIFFYCILLMPYITASDNKKIIPTFGQAVRNLGQFLNKASDEHTKKFRENAVFVAIAPFSIATISAIAVHGMMNSFGAHYKLISFLAGGMAASYKDDFNTGESFENTYDGDTKRLAQGVAVGLLTAVAISAFARNDYTKLCAAGLAGLGAGGVTFYFLEEYLGKKHVNS